MQGVLKLECASELLKGLLEHGLLEAIPRVSESVRLEWSQGSVALRSPVMLILLVQQPHFENHLHNEGTKMSKSGG